MHVSPVLDSRVRSPGMQFWILLKRIDLLERVRTRIKCFPSFSLTMLLWEQKSPSVYLITK